MPDIGIPVGLTAPGEPGAPGVIALPGEPGIIAEAAEGI